jgi:molybdate transport system regulatory protein
LEETLNCNLTIRLFKGEKVFGPGIALLLRNIERTGSLLKAAEAMNMAYSKAWKMIKEIEILWGFQLTHRDIGGQNGGGSTLTPEGLYLLERYESFTEDVRNKSEESFREYFSEDFYRNLEGFRTDKTKEEC